MDYKRIANILALQKRSLGLSEAALARLTGVSQPTVHRILSGQHERAAWADIVALSKVMGVSLTVIVMPPQDILEEKAEAVATQLVGKNQATNQLEGQGLSDQTQKAMIRQTVHRLLAGSKSKLWLEE
jgi:transcriptional regulator with XRE-family HTH domain